MSGKRFLTPLRLFTLGLLGVGAIVAGVIALLNAKVDDTPAAAATAGIYGQDVPPATMPEKLLPGYVLLTVHQLALVPEADGFQSPCGTAQGGFVYDAQPFGTPNPARGGKHTGCDINGIGGADTDLGLPVHAAARGLVVYVGEPSPAWGKVVVLAHRLPGENRIIQTLYAHLDKSIARLGQLVGRGATIGTVGNTDHSNVRIGKAGRKRHMGIRPTVRGVVMNPCDHPHGGGEGRSPVGMPAPMSPWGKKTQGVKTRKHRKYSDKLIISRANKKK